MTRARAGCPGDFFCNRGNIFKNRVMVSVFVRPCMHIIILLLTRGIHYFYRCVTTRLTHSTPDSTRANKILHTSHAYMHGARTVTKCVMSTVVTRNDTSLCITLFLCLYARDSLCVTRCNESPNSENCGVVRPATRTRTGCPGDFFFVNRGNIFENRVMVSVFT